MAAPERVLRLLFVPGKVHAEDFTVSPPYLAEIVNINGIERVRGYYIASNRTRTPFFFNRSSRHRSVTIYEWNVLTGERLASDLVPVSTERKTT